MKKKIEINKDILMGELVKKYPKLVNILVGKYGFHCVGCPAAEMESLEQGAMVHGMTKKEIEKMIKDLKSQVKAVGR